MKILLSNITDKGIYRARKEIILSLISNGYDIVTVAPPSDAVKKLENLGCKYIPININGHGINPCNDIFVVIRYFNILREEKPDVVLTYTIKPNLYCGFVCRILSIPQIMNITGIGTALSTENVRRSILLFLYRIAAKKVKCIFFQNKQNYNFFLQNKVATESVYKLLPGSGVNLSVFKTLPYPKTDEVVNFVFISRILKEKGIDNYIEAAKKIKNDNKIKTHFYVLGSCEKEYSHVLQNAENNGIIEYCGRVDDVIPYLKKCHCLIHPSYYPEGTSNVLLEASASGRPIITTNNPGCGNVIDDGITGFLTKANDTVDLTKKIYKFLSLSYEEKKRMGLSARFKVEKEFDRQIVVDEYLKQIKQYDFKS